MNCSEIANKIEAGNPGATPLEIARMCTLICTAVDDPESLNNDETFLSVWDDVNLKLQAATDQHAAVTQELEGLADSDPSEFSQDKIWILIRAIKVQSQVLRLYVGDENVRAN